MAEANDDAAKLRLAKPLFVEAACDWLDNLEPQKKDTYNHLETAFKERYIQPSILRIRSACELFGKKQRSDETVDAYVSRLRTLSKKVDVDDKALLYALLSGLKSPMASYVLGKNPQTFSEAVDAARLAEFSVAQGASHADQQLCTQLAEMRQDIQKLAQRYNSMSLTTAIQREKTRSPTPPPRKVTFQGDGCFIVTYHCLMWTMILSARAVIAYTSLTVTAHDMDSSSHLQRTDNVFPLLKLFTRKWCQLIG